VVVVELHGCALKRPVVPLFVIQYHSDDLTTKRIAKERAASDSVQQKTKHQEAKNYD
jgi:hypothetical protein